MWCEELNASDNEISMKRIGQCGDIIGIEDTSTRKKIFANQERASRPCNRNLHEKEETDLHEVLLESIQKKNINRFRYYLDVGIKEQRNTFDVNHCYSEHSDQTCMDIVCSQGLVEFVEPLLEKGANPNKINVLHNRAPIHFAAEAGHIDVLRLLLKHREVKPNLVVGHRTALHIAVKEFHETKEGKYLKCAALLLDHDANPNIPNNKGITALHLAAKIASREMVDLIMSRSKVPIYVDTYRDLSGRTARDVLQKNFPDISSLLPATHKDNVDCNDLRYYLTMNDPLFLKKLDAVNDDELDNEADKLLIMAMEINFQEAIEELLNRIKRTPGLTEVARAAVRLGNDKVLRILFKMYPDLADGQLLCDACIELNTRATDDSSSKLSCVKVILDQDDVDVCYVDAHGNTALHYADKAGCFEATTLLEEKRNAMSRTHNSKITKISESLMTPERKYVAGNKVLSQHDDELDNEAGKLLIMPMEINFREAIEELLKRIKRTPGLTDVATVAVRQGNAKVPRILFKMYPDLADGQLLRVDCMDLSTRATDDSSNKLPCVEVILDQDNVDVYYVDAHGNRALHYAAKAGCVKATKLLEEKQNATSRTSNSKVSKLSELLITSERKHVPLIMIQKNKEGVSGLSQIPRYRRITVDAM